MLTSVIRLSVIAVFLRVYKVIGLPIPLLLHKVHHHAPLQLQLEALIISRVRRHLLLRTRILTRMWLSLPLYRVPVHTNLRFLPLPVVLTVTRNSSAASKSWSSTRSHITLSSPPAIISQACRLCV